MAGKFNRTAAERGLAQIRHVSPVRPGAASGLVARVYAQVERDFGMLAPPVALHSPAAGPTAASWLILRETLVATGGLRRAAKEAVAAAVSLGNACPYCVDVHTATLHGVVDGSDALAVLADRIESVAAPDVRAAAAWARVSGQRAGANAHRPPVPAAHLPELVGVAVTFHYFNRMVHVFLPDSPIPPQVPGIARGGFWRLLGRFMWRAAGATHEPGDSCGLLPPADLPDDLSWAAGAEHIAGAFARAAATVELAGARSVPQPVRELVLARLAGWQGEPPGVSRAWLEDDVAGLAPADRPAGWPCSPRWPRIRSTSGSSDSSGPAVPPTGRWLSSPRGPASPPRGGWAPGSSTTTGSSGRPPDSAWPAGRLTRPGPPAA